MKPSDFGLTHEAWRPHQLETVEWAQKMSGQVFLEMPTGSGKTSIAASLAQQGSVIALSQTKMLQKANYGDAYGFDVLFGRGNYPCAYHGNGVTGAECPFGRNMHECPSAHECEYLEQKAIVQGSAKVALNYAYYFGARWPRQHGTTYLVLDECDELPEIVLDRAGTTVTEQQRKQYGLPAFPGINSKASAGLGPDPVPAAIGWLKSCLATLREQQRALEQASPGSSGSKRLVTLMHFKQKLETTVEALEAAPTDWFIRSGANARSFKRATQPGFVARPLTARHHARLWIPDADRANLMMSATIGDPATLSAELGIADFTYHNVPSVWPAESRYIWAPKDAPAIGQKATEIDYLRQAEMMADVIKSAPKDWSGVGLLTRKSEAPLVAQRLAKLGLGDRVWVPPEVGTDQQTVAWEQQKRKAPGSIMLSWSHWRGWDGLDEKMLFVLKTPFPFLGDEYERERRTYDGKVFFWRTGNLLSQGLGRTRRGRPEDYDTDKEVNGLVTILDANWRRVQKYIPQYLKESIIQ